MVKMDNFDIEFYHNFQKYKHWWGSRETGTLTCCWVECKMAGHFGKRLDTVTIYVHTMKYYLAIKRWNTDTGYNKNKPCNVMLSEEARHKGPHIVWFHLWAVLKRQI